MRKRSERGFSLPLIAVTIFVMLGMLGLALDLGQMYIVKNELQTFCDASALAAVHQFDGTSTGVQGANTTATAGPLGTAQPNGYYFESKPISNVTATYATSASGTYDSYATAVSNPTNNYIFINVTASATIPILFMPVIQGMPTSTTVTATATAGALQVSSVTNGGLEPFLPDAHNAADTTNFGFIPGQEYTLKWVKADAKGNGTSTCAGDASWRDPNPSSQHGFVDLGQGNGNSSLRSQIEYCGYPNANSTPSSVYAGISLGGVPGDRGSSIFDALQNRVDQDTDISSATYSEYISDGQGNGRRVVTVPIGDPSTWTGNGNGSETVIGFANFLLETTYSGNSGVICAYYIGPANLNGYSAGVTDATKVYFNVLFK